jgi:uncharacterized protein YcbK (DUF882 family)
LGVGFRPVVSGMSFESNVAGQAVQLKKSGFRSTLTSLALATSLVVGAWLGTAAPLDAAGETRTLSMYHVHTKERLTVTYMKNGRYIPSEMKKVNYFLRDWRRNKTVTIDPKTIDLMWELHADLGSRREIHIVSGHRSARTNAFLKRSGRNVAKKSQHIKGKAIDFFFPDVNTKKIRDSALVRRVGGVGYYRASTGPSGFLHVDSGNVRHWGFTMSKSQWAKIVKENRRSVGRRLNKSDSIAVASAGEPKRSIVDRLLGRNKKEVEVISEPVPEVAAEEDIPPIPDYAGFDDDLTDLVGDVSKEPKKKPIVQEPEALEEVPVAEAKPRRKPAASDEGTANAQLAALAQTAATEEAAESVADDSAKVAGRKVVPKPRTKPAGLQIAAASLGGGILIEPASAPPDSAINKPTSKIDSKLLAKKKAEELLKKQAEAEAAAADEAELAAASSDFADGKSDFAAEIRDGRAEDAPLIRTNIASASSANLVVPVEQLIRQNGAPQPLEAESESVLPLASSAQAAEPSVADANSEGKVDLVLINRDGKGNLEELPEGETSNRLKLGQLETE